MPKPLRKPTAKTIRNNITYLKQQLPGVALRGGDVDGYQRRIRMFEEQLAQLKPRPKPTATEVRYDYRGDVERAISSHGYVWREGYSGTSADGHILYPWNTMREIQKAERARGNKAVFYRDGVRIGQIGQKK